MLTPIRLKDVWPERAIGMWLDMAKAPIHLAPIAAARGKTAQTNRRRVQAPGDPAADRDGDAQSATPPPSAMAVLAPTWSAPLATALLVLGQPRSASKSTPAAAANMQASAVRLSVAFPTATAQHATSAGDRTAKLR